MKPQLVEQQEKRLVGKRLNMTIANDKTAALWASFMPKRKEIIHTVGSAFYSLQCYPPTYFDVFDPNASFEKWAAVAVTDTAPVPEGMETITIPRGLYAVFLYKGLSTDSAIFQYIYTTWLPASGYVLSHRPHFELLGEKYKNNDPNSEEEIWIPIESSKGSSLKRRITRRCCVKSRTMNQLNSEVTQLLDNLAHPLRKDIEMLRKEILQADT